MSYKACENCGCRIYNGICTNCEEENYIFETQYEWLPDNISEEFQEKVTEQKLVQKERLRKE